MAIDRVTPDEFGLDEVVAADALVHIERMSPTHVWISIGCGKDQLRINYHAKGAIKANIERWTESSPNLPSGDRNG